MVGIVGVRNPLLHFYWIEFVSSPHRGDEGHTFGWLHKVCGVTAYTLDDALYLIREQLCWGRSLPAIHAVIEDVNLSTLDRGHVLPNFGVPIFRGVWYPMIDSQGYQRGQHMERSSGE